MSWQVRVDVVHPGGRNSKAPNVFVQRGLQDGMYVIGGMSLPHPSALCPPGDTVVRAVNGEGGFIFAYVYECCYELGH